ncbi:hypothetical protein J3Q64DRAFT_1634989, partial [Phycomyces blakesleeanus]
NDSNDYEKILSDLDEAIQKSQLRIADIKIRQRRALALWVLYSSILWAVYLVYCIFTLYNQNKGIRAIVNAGIPLILFPFVIYYMRIALAWFYSRKQTAEESRLSTMMTHKNQKLDELKNKTSYYTTHSLLERYDLSESKKSQSVGAVTVSLPAQRPQPLPELPTPLNARNDTQKGNMMSQFSTVPRQPRWFDKMFEALVGEEKSEERYALICDHCFSHNGLVLPRERDSIQYVCPQCHKFNPSKAMATTTNSANNALSLSTRPKSDILIVEAAPPIELDNVKGKSVADRVINRHYAVLDESSSDNDDSE